MNFKQLKIGMYIKQGIIIGIKNPLPHCRKQYAEITYLDPDLLEDGPQTLTADVKTKFHLALDDYADNDREEYEDHIQSIIDEAKREIDVQIEILRNVKNVLQQIDISVNFPE